VIPRRLISLARSNLPTWALVVAGFAILASPIVSMNSHLWLIAIVALVFGSWCIGWPTYYPVLLWIVGINWLPIAADILNADLSGASLESDSLGSHRTVAISISLLAGVILAVGLRFGAKRMGSASRSLDETVSEDGRSISLNGSIVLFFSAYPIIVALTWVGYLSPGLQQPVLAFALLKFVFLYLLATTVFRLQRGYGWLILAVSVEVVNGMTGFFSDYKEAFFIVLIALASRREKINTRLVITGGAAVVVVIWFSLVWTAIKPEYRQWVSENTGTQTVARPVGERIDFISQRILLGGLDYETSYLRLLRRIGYTEYYARILARLQTNSMDVPSQYLAAVQHTLMPRLLFPDKATLNDSAVTTAFTGDVIDSNTSISVGYVAEAHADFGFPWMLAPILLIGLMIGVQARYFMTRNAPLIVRQAFCTGCLFSSFGYQMNIDKALGGCLVGFIAMTLALKFGYPLVSSWLESEIMPTQIAEV
jgi:hypothetical protein